jgi:protein involved in polysaccharide export with SLBB domain
MPIKSNFITCLSIISFYSYGQNIKPAQLGQFKTVLESKGVSEEELKQSLNQKGLSVETMTEADALNNRPVIEQTIGELEQKNKAKYTQTKTSAKPDTLLASQFEKKEVSLIKKDSLPISKLSNIYGHSIFQNKSLDFSRISKDASPPDTYVLAPGDRIAIVIFGRSQADLQYEISSAGFIQPAQMPKIFLSGLTLKQAKALLINRFSTYYVFNSDQFALTLSTSRTLTVNIFGEVDKPASYTTSALNTAINVLSASGGPTDLGSVRSIQVIRGNTRKYLDVYAFMRDPVVQYDFYLQNNDILYIPPAEIIVKVEGGVNRPMFYEMKKKETVKDLISFAGGFKKDAYTDIVQIERYENNQVILKDYSLQEVLDNKVNLTFLNGDIIRFKSIYSPLKAVVKISGAISYPGNYAINSAKNISALVEKAKLNAEAKIDQAFLFRKRLDLSTQVISIPLKEILNKTKPEIPLENEDSLVIFDQARYVEKFKIKVVGEVKVPFEQSFKYGEGLTVQEAVVLAGGLTTDAFSEAYVYRTNPLSSKQTTYIPLQVNSNFSLVSGDQLVILNKEQYTYESSINISGEVNKPLQLRFDPSLKLAGLFQLAGGITRAADMNRVDVFRLNFSTSESPKKSLITLQLDKNFQIISGPTDFQLSPFDYVVIRKIVDFRLNEAVQVTGEVKYPGQYVLKNAEYHFSDLIMDAGGLTKVSDLWNAKLTRYLDSSGILVFDAHKALNHKGSFKYDPILKENDYIEIPKISSVINIEVNATKYILGESQKSLQIIYQGPHSAKWYITRFAGGLAKKADKKSILVIRTNGLASGTKKVLGLFKKYPKVRYGDTIRVSYEVEKPAEKKDDKPLDWDKMLAKIISVGTLYALIANATR